MVKTNSWKEVENFVKENLVRADNMRIECGDGRYKPEQSEGAIRAFGGDFGMVMAFAGALKSEGTFIDPDEIVERYYRAVKDFRGEDAKLYYHTDEHKHKEGKIGCGHAAGASDPANKDMYGITSDEARGLYEAFAKHPRSNSTVLEGEHKERGVIYLEGKTHSLNSRRGHEMYFVVTPTQIDEAIDILTPIFSKGLVVPVDAEDVKAYYIRQQYATAKLLGADKLPVYSVRVKPSGHFVMQQLPQKRKTN